MDDFTDYQRYKINKSQGQIINIATKVIIPLGLFLIAIISFLTSATEVPAWAYWIMAIYLVTTFLIILVLLAKNIIPNTINWFSRRRFAKKKRPELQELSNELNELLGSDRSNTIPYFISQLSSKLTTEVNLLSCLDRNSQQFKILQSWSWALSENLHSGNHKLFLREVIQFSRLVSWFAWACEWVRQVLDKTEIREKIPREVVSDWNVAVQRISDITSRVTRMIKSINNKYNTGICITSFQDVKPL